MKMNDITSLIDKCYNEKLALIKKIRIEKKEFYKKMNKNEINDIVQVDELSTLLEDRLLI